MNDQVYVDGDKVSVCEMFDVFVLPSQMPHGLREGVNHGVRGGVFVCRMRHFFNQHIRQEHLSRLTLLAVESELKALVH